jgi:transcription-repair coupling factor (superfamily II helicase)
MFNKTQYKLLIEEYMDKYGVTYTTAKQLICLHQIRRYMEEKQVSYEIACIADDIINNYNISP